MKRTEPEHLARGKRARASASEPLELVLDTQEHPGLPERVRALWRPVVVRALPVGDVEVGRILIERKTARDFMNSLSSGRLFRQAYQLRSACARPLVLVEGDPYALVDPRGVPGLRGAVLSLLTGYGIPVLRTRDLSDTAQTLARIARQESRRAGRRRAARGPRPRSAGAVGPKRDPALTPEERRIALECLGALPGVGRSRSEALLEHFGSLDLFFRATWDELRRAPGVGGATAARILQARSRSAPPSEGRGVDGERSPEESAGGDEESAGD